MEQVLQMESDVLNYLKFEMTAPTTKCFLRQVFFFMFFKVILIRRYHVTKFHILSYLNRRFVRAAQGVVVHEVSSDHFSYYDICFYLSRSIFLCTQQLNLYCFNHHHRHSQCNWSA